MAGVIHWESAVIINFSYLPSLPLAGVVDLEGSHPLKRPLGKESDAGLFWLRH